MPEKENSNLAHALLEGNRSALRALRRLLAPAKVSVAPVEWIKAPHCGNYFVVHLRIEGRPKLKLFLVADELDGAALASALLKRDVDAQDPVTHEALGELANISASSFLNGLSQVSEVSLLPTVPIIETTDARDLRAMLEAPNTQAYEAPFDVTLPAASVRVVLVGIDESGSL